MTSENDAKRPTQDPGQPPEKSKSPLAAINDSAVAQKANQALKTVTGTAEKVQRNPIIAHLLRATERLTTEWETSSAPPSPTSHFCR